MKHRIGEADRLHCWTRENPVRLTVNEDSRCLARRGTNCELTGLRQNSLAGASILSVTSHVISPDRRRELLEPGQPDVFHTLRQILQDVEQFGGGSDSGTDKQRNVRLNECCDAVVL